MRSRGRVINALDIDEIRWPLAGVKTMQRGVDGRLQAILRAHENTILMAWRMIFSPIPGVGGGAIGGKEVLRQ